MSDTTETRDGSDRAWRRVAITAAAGVAAPIAMALVGGAAPIAAAIAALAVGAVGLAIAVEE